MTVHCFLQLPAVDPAVIVTFLHKASTDVIQFGHECHSSFWVRWSGIAAKVGSNLAAVHLIIVKLQLGTHKDRSDLLQLCEPAVTSSSRAMLWSHAGIWMIGYLSSGCWRSVLKRLWRIEAGITLAVLTAGGFRPRWSQISHMKSI